MYLGDVILDGEMVDTYQVSRSKGKFVMGLGWQSEASSTFDVYGVVSAISGKDLQALPEADRIHQTRAFWSNVELFITHASAPAGTSDLIIWRGDKYRIVTVGQYENRGYWKAIAVRMAGN